MAKAKAVRKPRRAKFDYSLDFKNLDLRREPHLYRIGLGEQGVLSVEPYKSEILPLWRFKTPDIARVSSADLKKKFEDYRRQQDFIGMDMTRKFIQMGVTRARRYANWSGGKKYTGEVDEDGKKLKVERGPEDEVKAESARIFGVVLREVQQDEEYIRMAEQHRTRYENATTETDVKPATKKDSEGEGEIEQKQSPLPARQTRSRVKTEDLDA